MYKYLDGVNSPQDIKKLKIYELEALSKEIRKFLVKNIANTGGHLASNLGVVELTLALFKVFDSPRDKFIWDVGHQAYVHKILTGRKDYFSTLRQFGGLSGFPKESESEHDIFDTGHSSTSISAGVGIASARDIQGENFNVISIIGDGAITGGMAFEALNNLGYMKKNMIVIFNDNEMSIDKNTGAFSNYMSKIMRSADTIAIRNNIDKIMNMTQVGEKISRRATKLTDSILTSISPSECGLIDSLGIKYFGPIDGHNISDLIEILEYVKHIDGPKFIHIKTIKGKGYKYAEKYPENYHGVSKFDYKKGVIPGNKRSISSIVGMTLAEMANYNKNIVAITAAMPAGTGLNIFEKIHPDRYFDVGIAEQHAVTFSAGLAKQGLKPYFAVYSTFLQRAYDQLIHDVCITKKDVTFLIDRAGLVGNDGETHHGEFDLSYLNPIPNLVVMAPKDSAELVDMIKFSENISTPVAIRYPRGNEFKFNLRNYGFYTGYVGYMNEDTKRECEKYTEKGSTGNEYNNSQEYAEKDIAEGIKYNEGVENGIEKSVEKNEISLGKPELIFKNLVEGTTKVLVLSIGNMLENSVKAVDNIFKYRDDVSFSIVNSRFLKPLDEEVFVDLIKEVDVVLTVEDNVITGGFASRIEDLINENKLNKPLKKLGLPNEFIPHGDVDILFEEVGLSYEKIAEKIMGFVDER